MTRTLALQLNPAAPLKDPKDYTIVGKPIPRVDIPAKVFGTFKFVHDVRVPGMLHARVVHPAAVRATLQSFDDTACRKIKGYVRTVRKGDFLAVVATNEWAAISAATAIVAKWSAWAGLPDEAQLFEYVRALEDRPHRGLADRGRYGRTVSSRPRERLQATYDLAMNTHGSIGPSCAVADFKNGQLTVWTPSQASHLLRAQLATMLQMKAENVRCIYVEGAGCYGRNGSDDCSSEAALIAKEIGRPVRLQWMRQDEHGWDPKGPPTLLDYRASLDDQGGIAAWESDIFLPERPMQRSGVTLARRRRSPTCQSSAPRHPRISQSWAWHPLRIAEQQADRALARRHAAARGVDSRAGAHAEHVRQRELSRRDRGCHGRRSVRDPHAHAHRRRAGSSCSSACGSSPNGSRAAGRRATRAPWRVDAA